MTWWILSTGLLLCGFLIVVGTGFIAKSRNKGMKSFLNSDPLSKTTFLGLGYLVSHVWLNNWLIRADVLSITVCTPFLTSSMSKLGTSAISNHPVAGSTNVMHVSLNSLVWIEPSGCICFAVFEYGPIKSMWIVCHGTISYSTILAGRCPFWRLRFLPHWQMGHLWQYAMQA